MPLASGRGVQVSMKVGLISSVIRCSMSSDSMIMSDGGLKWEQMHVCAPQRLLMVWGFLKWPHYYDYYLKLSTVLEELLPNKQLTLDMSKAFDREQGIRQTVKESLRTPCEVGAGGLPVRQQDFWGFKLILGYIYNYMYLSYLSSLLYCQYIDCVHQLSCYPFYYLGAGHSISILSITKREY